VFTGYIFETATPHDFEMYDDIITDIPYTQHNADEFDRAVYISKFVGVYSANLANRK